MLFVNEDSFPEMVLSPHELFLEVLALECRLQTSPAGLLHPEENFTPLLRPSDEFAAKVQPPKLA